MLKCCQRHPSSNTHESSALFNYLLQATGVAYRVQVVHHEAQRIGWAFPSKQESKKTGNDLLSLHLFINLGDLIQHDKLQSFVKFVFQDGIRKKDVTHASSLVIIFHATKFSPLKTDIKVELRGSGWIHTPLILKYLYNKPWGEWNFNFSFYIFYIFWRWFFFNPKYLWPLQ